jgi:hypothetical protein
MKIGLKILMVLGVFLGVIIYLSAGFAGLLTQDLAYYVSEADVRTGANQNAERLPAGQQVELAGCYDMKTDIYFQVIDQSGRSLYVDRLPVELHRTLPTSQQLARLFHAPLETLNCLTMAPRMADR